MHSLSPILLLSLLSSPVLSQTQTTTTQHTTSTPDTIACIAAGASLISMFAALPTPAPALASYFKTAERNETDVCSLLASTPASLRSEASSYSSAVSSVVSANAGAVSTVSACGSQAGIGKPEGVTSLLHLTDCTAPTGTAAGGSGSDQSTASASQNAGVAEAREIGMAAAGMVAAIIGAVVLL